MKNRLIKITAASPRLRPADVEYNTERIIEMIRSSSDSGVIVFPELSVTGYTCADLFGSDLLLDKAEEALFIIARATTDTYLTAAVGLPARYGNSLYNCAALLSRGEVKALVPKSYIPTYSEFYESRWFASGKDIHGESIRLRGRNIPFGTDILIFDPVTEAVLGAEICEDLWVPDKPSTHAALAGANIIVNLSASDELIGKKEYRSRLAAQQSGSCCCVYAYSSAGTDESSTDLVFSAHDIIAQNGNILSESIFPGAGGEELSVLADIGCVMHDRRRQNTFCDEGAAGYRRIEARIQAAGGDSADARGLAGILSRYDYPVPRNPFIPSDSGEREQRCRRILEIQANGLATRVRAAGIYDLVIGISGGLDSTLAMIVCAEAKKLIPEIRIIAYTMPNKGNTSGLTYNNAKRLMELLADESYDVPIGESVALHLAAIGHEQGYQGEGDTAYENAQARMRTMILMNAANMKGGLVVGTGDLSELALGWCTYNGDHMSMYAVNASVPKTLVRYICRCYAGMCGSEALRETLLSICVTPITPELTPTRGGEIAQMTEEKIGRYDLNDLFLYYTLRWGFEPQRCVSYAVRAYPELSCEEISGAAKRFFKRFITQQFKRSCLPDGPKVGSVSLSPRGDWRMPSDASYRIWADSLDEL